MLVQNFDQISEDTLLKYVETLLKDTEIYSLETNLRFEINQPMANTAGANKFSSTMYKLGL